RARNPILRWLGLVLTGLLTLVFALVSVLALVGVYQLSAPRSNPVRTLSATASPAQTAQAQKGLLLCATCHSSTGQLPLDGAKASIVAGFFDLPPPNPTPAGTIRSRPR